MTILLEMGGRFSEFVLNDSFCHAAKPPKSSSHGFFRAKNSVGSRRIQRRRAPLVRPTWNLRRDGGWPTRLFRPGLDFISQDVILDLKPANPSASARLFIQKHGISGVRLHLDVVVLGHFGDSTDQAGRDFFRKILLGSKMQFFESWDRPVDFCTLDLSLLIKGITSELGPKFQISSILGNKR